MKKGGHLDGLLLFPPMTRAAALAKKSNRAFLQLLGKYFFAADMAHRHRMDGGKEKKPYGTN